MEENNDNIPIALNQPVEEIHESIINSNIPSVKQENETKIDEQKEEQKEEKKEEQKIEEEPKIVEQTEEHVETEIQKSSQKNDEQRDKEESKKEEKVEENIKIQFNEIKEAENIHNLITQKVKTKIVEIICKLSNEQRQLLKNSYISQYGQELDKELNSLLSGKVKDLISDLMMNPIDFAAKEINESMRGLGTNEESLSEMLSTRTNRQIGKIKEAYIKLYKNTLEDDIKGDTSGTYEKILIAFSQGMRSDNPYPNTQKMKEIVQKLKEDEEGKINKDEYIRLFSTCSYGEICTIYRLYKKTYNKNLIDEIKKEFDKDTFTFMNYFLSYISDPGAFFAEKIHKFDDQSLRRILVLRNEIDMDDIRYSYKELYNTELVDDIESKFKDDYQLALRILAQK